MISPIRWYGGKFMMMEKLLRYFPPVEDYYSYLEPFGGSGNVLLNKPYKPIEIYNDLDKNLSAFMEVMTDDILCDEFMRRADLHSIWSEDWANRCKAKLKDDNLPLLDRALAFFYINRTHRAGGNGGLGINLQVRRNMSKSVSDLLSALDRLPEFHARWSTVLVLCRDALELIKKYDRVGWLYYLDPPYVPSARKSDSKYTVDVDDGFHVKLIQALLEIKHARVLISGYDHPIYDDLVKNGWIHDQFTVKTVDSQNEKRETVETVWRNYEKTTSFQLNLFEWDRVGETQ